MGNDDYGIIVERLEAVTTTKELFQALDAAIDNSMNPLFPVKTRFDKLRFLTISEVKKMMVRDIENLQELTIPA